jgi:hypothetical protein
MLPRQGAAAFLTPAYMAVPLTISPYKIMIAKKHRLTHYYQFKAYSGAP